MGLTAGFSAETTLQARNEWKNIFKVKKKENLQLTLCIMVKDWIIQHFPLDHEQGRDICSHHSYLMQCWKF